jgi:hypothetical protein
MPAEPSPRWSRCGSYSYHDAAELQALVEAGPAAQAATYLVCESIPQAYGEVMTWQEGEQSPGLSIVTMLDKPEGTDEKVFFHYWHELHRITTAQCHPFASYVRNEVARALTDGAPRYPRDRDGVLSRRAGLPRSAPVLRVRRGQGAAARERQAGRRRNGGVSSTSPPSR